MAEDSEEIYDDGEQSLVSSAKAKFDRPLLTQKPQLKPKPKPEPKPKFSESNSQATTEVGMSLKDRMAKLSQVNGGLGMIIKPQPSDSNSPVGQKEFTSQNNTSSPQQTQHSTTHSVKRPGHIPKQAILPTNQQIAAAIIARSHSKKVASETPVIVQSGNGVQFTKVPFIAPTDSAPTKPASIPSVDLPEVSYKPDSPDILMRDTNARQGQNAESVIKSMTEEDELAEEIACEENYDDADIAPPRILNLPPSRPAHNSTPEPPRRPAPQVPANDGLEIYDDGEATEQERPGDELEVYEEVESTSNTRKMANSSAVEADEVAPDPPVVRREKKEIDPKEKKRLEKEAKAIEQARIKEVREHDRIMKTYKVTGEDLTSNEHVKVKAAAKGGKDMLTVEANEFVFLLRKLDKPKGKWVVKNRTGKVGLLDATNVIDDNSNTISVQPNTEDIIEEDIYEEI